jgi:thioester reductase-like protein
MLLVLGIPDPVALCLVSRLADRGERVAVVSGPEFQDEFGEGVEVYPGDSASIDFGVTGEDYNRLLGRVSMVYLAHSTLRGAGEVEKSRVVRQASEVREFVRAGGAPQGVSFLSSLLVFGNARGSVTEADFQVGQKFGDEYEESLAVAERIIRSMKGERPLSIVRTGPVVGDEETGELLPGSPLAHLVRTIERNSEDKGYVFSDLPVRYETVGRAVAALLRTNPQRGIQMLHLVDEDPLSDRQLTLWVAERLQKQIVESSNGPRPWSSLGRSSYPGSRALSGWGLHFSRMNAEAQIASLLDRDEARVLEKLLPRDETIDE